MEKSYERKIWEPVDFTIYFKFIRWWVVLAVVLELVFRIWINGIGTGMLFEQMEIVSWALRIVIFVVLGWRVVRSFGYSTPIALISGGCAGFFVGIIISLTRFFDGLAIWKFANLITEAILATIVGSLVVLLVIFVLGIKNN